MTGTLPNGNTTATSANTASAIVARDSNGDFTARDITARTIIGSAGSGTEVFGAGSISFQWGGVAQFRVGNGDAGMEANKAFMCYSDGTCDIGGTSNRFNHEYLKGAIQFSNLATPSTPSSGNIRLYAKSELPTFLNSSGTESTLLSGTTGSVDNMILRSDGTGGGTAQASGVQINDVASTNVTITTTNAATASSLVS